MNTTITIRAGGGLNQDNRQERHHADDHDDPRRQRQLHRPLRLREQAMNTTTTIRAGSASCIDPYG